MYNEQKSNTLLTEGNSMLSGIMKPAVGLPFRNQQAYHVVHAHPSTFFRTLFYSTFRVHGGNGECSTWPFWSLDQVTPDIVRYEGLNGRRNFFVQLEAGFCTGQVQFRVRKESFLC